MRNRVLLLVAAFTVTLAGLPAGAQERRFNVGDIPTTPTVGRKFALVIGNNAYPTQALRNAVPDATSISAALKGLGFEVTALTDVGLAQMEREIDRFAGGLTSNDVALFFYSGHGMQVQNVNYLIPVDFKGQDEYDVKARSVSADAVHDKMQGAGTRILILDACRNNPFRGTRSGSLGLADMAGRGSLIAYSAGPGETASDVGIKPGSRNGLFTEQLLDVLNEPGLTAVDLFRKVRQRVTEASGGKQFPWLSDGLLQDFTFRAGIRPDANNSGKLLVMCDRDCEVSVDGVSAGTVAAGQSVSVTALIGQHQVAVTHRVPTGETLTWQRIVSLDSPVQMLVETDLATPFGQWAKEQERLAELKRQEEARIAKELEDKRLAAIKAAEEEAARQERLRQEELERQRAAAAAKALKDAEFFKTVAGKWMRDVEDQQGAQNKTRTQDVVTIETTCAGVLDRTVTYFERGFSGWKRVRSEPNRLTFQCDGDGNLSGSLSGQIAPVPAQNAVSISGTPYTRGK